ncbi:MAG: hypothetical protein U5K74_04485 [Gemmatimonadaceae bacterium]|nr:hypothetical protein [Gemmatimonadaceae bacterium]
MAITPLTAQLPSLAGALPDLFRRSDGAPVRGDDAAPQGAGDPATPAHDEQRALAARASDDTVRMLARRAALGPLTYGRRMVPTDAPAPAPIGMRGAHLDVRG